MDCMQQTFRRDVLLGGRFQTVSPLNHGTFGMVFTAFDILTQDMVAVKCTPKSQPDGLSSPCPTAVSIDDRSEELAIHTSIGHHDNIVGLVTAFDTDHHSYLVLEYCPNGDLYEAIRANKGPLETEHVRSFMLQLVDAVGHLHSKNIFHRDIKPENIFLTRDGSMKLGDFGLATTDVRSVESGVGSDRYMAPEQFDCTQTDGYAPAAADIWAIGICLLNVLFGRNPFASPTPEDPLFADFVRDNQSLFDVFPNMSEDTYRVLLSCLAIDPDKRNLKDVRLALQQVVNFTTDEEALDEFCTGSDVLGTTKGREPLRTPSVITPQAEETAFPWAKALHTPQKHNRQLSIIHDEDMFPEPARRFEPDVASLASALDSGIGMSYKSSNLSSVPIGVPMSSSLPTHRAMATIYANDSDFFSKSWSDLWEEEEEEKARSSLEIDEHFEPDIDVTYGKVDASLFSRASTPAIDIKPSSRGSSTPRVGLSELGTANSRAQSQNVARLGQFQFGQFAKSVPARDSPVKRTGSFLMDKWAALGNLRRSNQPISAAATPQPTTPMTKRPTIRDRSGSWRKSTHSPYTNEVWNLSKDWRSPQQPNNLPEAGTSPGRSRDSLSSMPRRKSPRRTPGHVVDDIGDMDWVGGWQDLHL